MKTLLVGRALISQRLHPVGFSSWQVYDVLKHVAGMSNEELGATFEDWNTGELQVGDARFSLHSSWGGTPSMEAKSAEAPDFH